MATTMRNIKQFELKFKPSLIPEIAARYSYSFQKEDDALKAGEQIRSGEYTRTNLERIFEWKTKGRGRSRLLVNTDEEIADTLKLAMAAKTDRAAVAVLIGLSGVQVPVSSAILTAINPESFTIIDFRALEALGVIQPSINIDFYLKYLNKCRSLAKENNVPLRTLDRALWQWSKENSDLPASKTSFPRKL
ncbi:MAG TPA: hypothetical protein VMR99_03405 [Candidatus Paceibacterota bacterium]|nr:hypothetical protein [Candidatus Paceibacterota bacterium]